MEDHRENARILVIDDDARQLTVISQQLGFAGYDVHLAADGEKGLRATRELEPELVLCDWVMPGLDGLDYCREIKSDPDLQATYITMLTGRDSTEDRIRGLDAGADDFLVKPVRTNELLAHVRAGLRITSLRQRLAEAQHKFALLELAATLGHEINNPLSALFGHLELTRQYLGSGNTSRLEHHLRQATEVSRRIAQVAQKLTSLRDPKTTPYLGDVRMLDLEPTATD